MPNKRIKDKPEIGRSLNDNDLLFVTKTNEDTDNNATYSRVKNNITEYVTGVTQNLYTQGIDAGTNIYTGGTDTNPSVSLRDNISLVSVSADTINVSGPSSLGVVSATTTVTNEIDAVFANLDIVTIERTIDNLNFGLLKNINLSEGTQSWAGYTARVGATKSGLFGHFSDNFTGGPTYGNLLGHLSGRTGFCNFAGAGLSIAAFQVGTNINFYTGGPFLANKRMEINNTEINAFVPFSSATVSATTFYGDGSNLTGVVGNELLTPVYLTYDGTSGTSSGTHGITLTAPGEWTITRFGYIYYIDDKGGDIEVTVPDTSALNEGKVFTFTKPRLVTSNNRITLKTVSGQNIAQNSTFKLNSPDDVVQLVSNNFGPNGSPEWKYRLTYRSINEPQVLRVSPEGTALFSTIKSAVDYANNYLTNEAVVLIEPGSYYISETINITKDKLKILGRGSEITNIYATPALSGNSIFKVFVNSADFENLSMSGSLQTYSAIQFSGTPYCEMHTLIIDGFERGICFDAPGTEIWLMDSVIKNCSLAGICNLGGASIGTSEMTFENNFYGINFWTGDTQRHSVQNSIFLVNTGQTGIQWWTDQNTYEYTFFSNNAFYGEGTYISGFTFNTAKDANIKIENNVGIDEYKPQSWIWVSGNTTATTLTTQGEYYAASILAASVVDYDFIKFSGTGLNTQSTYLSTTPYKGKFVISGDISASNNNDILSVALYKNSTKK